MDIRMLELKQTNIYIYIYIYIYIRVYEKVKIFCNWIPTPMHTQMRTNFNMYSS